MPKIIKDGTDECSIDACPIPSGDGSSLVRFAVIGDYDDNANTLAVANMVESHDVDFVVTVGDNNYATASDADVDDQIGQYYGDFIGNYKGTYGTGSVKNLFFPALGNQDWISSSVTWYTDYLTLPGINGNTSENERYYSFQMGNIEFFCISSDDNEPDGNISTSIQAVWLQNALSQSNAQFKVVYFHHNAYGSDTSHAEGENSNMRWPFDTWGADIVLNGHVHLYERLEVDGFTFINVGTGGRTLRTGTDEAETIVKYFAAHGAVIAEVTDRTATFRFYNVSDVLIDQVKIFKAPALDETIPPVSKNKHNLNW